VERLQDAVRSAVAWWSGQQLLIRGGLLGAIGIVFGGVVAVALLSGGSDGPPVVASTPTTVVSASVSPTPTVDPATATPGATATPRPSATVEPTATPEPTPTPEPAISNISDLVSQFGHPAGYNFARMRIPVLGVDAPVGASLVDGAAGAVMGVPEGPATVFWYDLSEWTNFGGLPGEGRNAIFSGHVDLASYVPYADVNYSGPAIFSDLELLQPGDRIFVDYNGESLEYVVAWKEQVNAGDTGRWGDIWSSNVPTDSITLYTCGGEFNFAEASYIDRVVIRAERA
jgi:hypothetical protein